MSEHTRPLDHTAPLPDPRTQPTVSVEAAAAILGVARQTVYRAVRAGEIPSIHVGRLVRIPTARLLALLGQETPPGSESQHETAGALAAS